MAMKNEPDYSSAAVTRRGHYHLAVASYACCHFRHVAAFYFYRHDFISSIARFSRAIMPPISRDARICDTS